MFLKLFSKARPPDDLELVLKYQRTGDTECIGELFERYTEMVYLICQKYLKDDEESKDATMQIFENLLIILKKHEVSNFKSWLHVTSKNHCLMQLRAKKLKEKAFIDSGASAMETAFSLHLNEDEQLELRVQALEKGIAELPQEQRVCIELFYLKHKSYKEIAHLTGCELNKVKSYIQNGKRNLKIYVESHHEH